VAEPAIKQIYPNHVACALQMTLHHFWVGGSMCMNENLHKFQDSMQVEYSEFNINFELNLT
jgi:hypothetical protein